MSAMDRVYSRRGQDITERSAECLNRESPSWGGRGYPVDGDSPARRLAAMIQDPEGIALVQAIHDRKNRSGRTPNP